MSDVGDNNFVRYIYRGEEDEDIPRNVLMSLQTPESFVGWHSLSTPTSLNSFVAIESRRLEKMHSGAALA